MLPSPLSLLSESSSLFARRRDLVPVGCDAMRLLVRAAFFVAGLASSEFVYVWPPQGLSGIAQDRKRDVRR